MNNSKRNSKPTNNMNNINNVQMCNGEIDQATNNCTI